jgi:hypothetical protein
MEDRHHINAIRRDTIDHAVWPFEYLPYIDALQLRHDPAGVRKRAICTERRVRRSTTRWAYSGECCAMYS